MDKVERVFKFSPGEIRGHAIRLVLSERLFHSLEN